MTAIRCASAHASGGSADPSKGGTSERKKPNSSAGASRRTMAMPSWPSRAVPVKTVVVGVSSSGGFPVTSRMPQVMR